jgi:hypothetical protein
MAFLARAAFTRYPEVFLPLYDSIHSQYADLAHNPNLRRLIGDNRSAITHLGLYLGFLLAEIIRRDWRNATLITTVGLLNGVGWALCQNWKWAAPLWPQGNFNWWRCWESSGGISIGVAYGIAYYLTNRQMTDEQIRQNVPNARPNLERFGAYLGLVFGLGLSLKNGLKGWANIYIGNENYWNHVLWQIIGPSMLVVLMGLTAWIFFRRLPRHYQGDVFPHAYRLIWLVLIWQNVIAQLVTGPRSNWNEMAFKLYYVLLFLLSSIVIYHFHLIKKVTGEYPVPGAEVPPEPQPVPP